MIQSSNPNLIYLKLFLLLTLSIDLIKSSSSNSKSYSSSSSITSGSSSNGKSPISSTKGNQNSQTQDSFNPSPNYQQNQGKQKSSVRQKYFYPSSNEFLDVNGDYLYYPSTNTNQYQYFENDQKQQMRISPRQGYYQGNYFNSNPNPADFYDKTNRGFTDYSSSNGAQSSSISNSFMPSHQIQSQPSDIDSISIASEKQYQQHHGWGWSHHDHKLHATIQEGLKFLGLLGMLSILQGVLTAFTTTTRIVPGKRRKRGLGDTSTAISKVDQISRNLLPHLNNIVHVQESDIPMKCILGDFCLINRILIKELGPIEGEDIGHVLSSEMTKLLRKSHKMTLTDENWLKKAEESGRKPISQEVCYKEFPKCREMQNVSIPQQIYHVYPEFLVQVKH